MKVLGQQSQDVEDGGQVGQLTDII